MGIKEHGKRPGSLRSQGFKQKDSSRKTKTGEQSTCDDDDEDNRDCKIKDLPSETTISKNSL